MAHQSIVMELWDSGRHPPGSCWGYLDSLLAIKAAKDSEEVVGHVLTQM